eukprot:TRINITY_DN1577_c0_g2_i1.p1 TRINITY_DN1577_c0_g2~~TRINITY_DN1577_c0_g2_i1.p1  ORF type:complete len:322 (-),score=66.48 TRINITY_DN1577_c0_g2_i1:163-1128(-)
MQLLLQLASYVVQKITKSPDWIVRSEVAAISLTFCATATADAVLSTRENFRNEVQVNFGGTSSAKFCDGVGFVVEFKRPRSDDAADLEAHHPQMIATLNALSREKQYAYGVLTNMFTWRFFITETPAVTEQESNLKVTYFDISALNRDKNIDGAQLGQIVELVAAMAQLSVSGGRPTDLLARLKPTSGSSAAGSKGSRRGENLFRGFSQQGGPAQSAAQPQPGAQAQGGRNLKRKHPAAADSDARDCEAKLRHHLVAIAEAAARAMGAFVADGIADPVDEWLLDEQTVLAETLAASCSSAADKHLVRDIVYGAAMPVALPQ